MKYKYSVNGGASIGPFDSLDALVRAIRGSQFVSPATEDLIRGHFGVSNGESLWLCLTARNDTLIELVRA